jgi:hypothetical protein
MCAAVTAMFEMDGIAQAPAHIDEARRLYHFAAGLPCPLVHLEALAAIPHHLRHEGQAFKAAVLVECRKNLVFA